MKELNKPIANAATTAIQTLIDYHKEHDNDFEENNLSDGYHTFDELYEFRKMYNAAFFNLCAKLDNDLFQNHDVIEPTLSNPLYNVHKSWKHHDGELCFGGGWFIVVAMLPAGQITNHYKAKDWDLFDIPETDKAKYPFDGHTGQDVIERLKI